MIIYLEPPMSLKTFHIIFIVLSILLSFGYGVWAFWFYSHVGIFLYLVMGGLSLLLGVALVIYSQNVSRKLFSKC